MPFRYGSLPAHVVAAFSRCLGTAVLLVAATGCDDRGEPGDACKKTDAQCLDSKTELFCQDGVLVAGRCAGPDGCRETSEALLCDFSENRAGDTCASADQGNAQCRPSRTERIQCAAGQYVIEPCRGDRGCYKAGDKVQCDQSLGKLGERCSGSTHACTLDGKALLECVSGEFEQKAECHGERGCSVGGGSVQCDQRRGTVAP